MSHEIAKDLATGQAAMFANREGGLPWHRLGQHVDGCQTWAKAMALAHLDWTVSKGQLLNPTGQQIPAWGIFRNDDGQFLGTVGETYTPIQNVTMGEHVDATLGLIDGAHYETAGVLGVGERVWAMARIPYDIRIKGTDDISKSFLLCTTSHDGTLSYQMKLTSVRVVCNNTLTAALYGNSKQTIKVRHTRLAVQRLEEAKKNVGAIVRSIEDLNEKFNLLAKRKVNIQSYDNVMKKLFGDDYNSSTRKERQTLDIARLFESNDGDTFPEIRGTAYNLLNAVTEYTDHFRGIRRTDRFAGQSDDQIRTQGAIWGAGEVLKSKALEIILEATKDAELKPEISQKYESVEIPTQSGNSHLQRILDKMDLTVPDSE